MTKEKTQGFSLREFSAAVIGTGGLGCNIAVHLAGAGIRELILVDFDKISESNLNRQFLYNTEDIGKEKVFTAKLKLEKYAPDVKITAVSQKITKENIPPQISRADIIFFAADNKDARKAMADFSEKSGIPLMLAGIDGFYGKTYLYIPGLTPTPREAGMLDGKKAQENNSACAGLIGSLQASCGIRYLLTKDVSYGGKLTVFDDGSFSELIIKPKK